MAEKISTIQLKKGDILCHSGDDVEYLYLVVKGKLTAYTAYGNFVLGSENIACLTDAYFGICIFTYVATEDTFLSRLPFSGFSDLAKLFDLYHEEYSHFVMNHYKFIMELIRLYLSYLIRCRKTDSSFALDTKIERWEIDKLNALTAMEPSVFDAFYQTNNAIAVSGIVEASRFATVLNDALLQMADVLGINMEYIPPAPKPVEPAAQTYAEPIAEEDSRADAEILQELQNSMQQILQYANIGDEAAAEFLQLIRQLKECSDKLSSDETVRKLRRTIADGFYRIYYAVFMNSLSGEELPTVIKMFLNFGYMDEELLGSANSAALYKITRNVEQLCNNDHVYTIYNWLKHVLWGEKIPSKNGLEQTYEEFIKTSFRQGTLKGSQQEFLSDSDRMLRYEIDNMFRQTHYMTYGKVSSFLPILTSENFLKPLPQMLMSADTVMNTVNAVRNLDFSLFYRSTFYSNEELHIGREIIYTEVLPDIILLPCAGTNGVMWQEIESRDRVSPARMMFPIFYGGNTESLITNTLGRYRWEICKRIQGNSWNDISDRSLTSEYCDYLQFYKKNRDLNDAVKAKLKSTLQNCRNNFNEVFAKDYESWILYESRGNGKLNKIARQILATYCPFVKKVRDELRVNPMFTEHLERYERQCASKQHHLNNLIQSLTFRNIEIPKELRETKAFYAR